MNAPLPRSLDPAPGELLPGYLLRLSHRIGIPPGDLAHRCGLFQGNRVPTQHLVRLDADRAQQIATICRLDTAEVHGLTLAGQAPGYAPLGAVYLWQRQSPLNMANSGWVFTTFSRYCPDCLADTAHLPGGPIWHGSWRLPHTFICPDHDRHLAWRCPVCEAPAFSNGYRTDGRWRPSQLIPGPRIRLHPRRCRYRPAGGWDTPCAAELDRTPATGTAPSPAAVHAQQRLASAGAAGPGTTIASLGKPASPEQFFNDVRTTVLGICSTWPAAAEVFPDFEQLDLIAAHAQSVRQAPAERLGPQADGWLARSIDHPPADALQCAALMTLVIQILDTPGGHPAVVQLLSGLPAARAGRLRSLTPRCSPSMTAAIAEATRLPLVACGPPALFPQPPTHRGRLDPRTISDPLPNTWTAPLDALHGPVRHLRRDAAIRLVQMARGGPRASAGRYLGIPPGPLHATTLKVRTWQKVPGNAEAYQEALRQVAEIAVSEGRRGS
ncbi:TniQ family protein [Streptomyces griseus]|uniref:TniQ family protein n=1 Tax=Streptomyces griseus TaxID=1911 RepID=UPI003867D333|nr:TniQ family protein [Streptomyces fimicarius]